MAKMNVKKGDKVLIIAGKDNGKTGTVLECFASRNAVTVKGVILLLNTKNQDQLKIRAVLLNTKIKLMFQMFKLFVLLAIRQLELQLAQMKKAKRQEFVRNAVLF